MSVVSSERRARGVGATIAALVLGFAVLGGSPDTVGAQQPAQGGIPAAPPASKAPPAGSNSGTAKPAAKPKTDAGPSSGSNSDAGLRQRIEGLEEQLVDIQVQLGTLETLAKSSGAASASPAYRAGSFDHGAGGGNAVDTARIVGLEAQVKSLSQQVQQLSDQLRGLGGQPGRPSREGGLTAPGPNSASGGTTTLATAPPGAAPPGWTVSPQGAPIGGGRDPQPVRENAFASPPDVAGSTLPPVPAAATPFSGAGDPGGAKAAYEQAYQHLLQQDYGAAEVAFDEFLRAYPNDALAGNAQFWLGETHFVRGQFKPAASAFLKGYRNYGRSSKAPDSLLKLAMSLGRLGQKDEACSALGELSSRYPQATADVKNRAAAEKSRTGCP